MKKQTNTPNERIGQNPEKELNKIDVSNLPDTEFKTMVIRMHNELSRRIDEVSENLHKETQERTNQK